MTARGEIFIGDLIKALSGLRPRDTETASVIAGLLGMEPDEATVGLTVGAAVTSTLRTQGPGRRGETVPTALPAPVLAEDSGGGPRPAPSFPAPAPVPRRPGCLRDPGSTSAADFPPSEVRVRAPELAGRDVDFSLTVLRPPSVPLVPPAPAVPPIDAPGHEPDGNDGQASLPFEPPWTTDWARGLMFAAVSTPVESRTLDQRRLIGKVSSQQVVRAVPWQHRPSARRGVQLLTDHGPGMAPFHLDRAWLRDLVESVAGRDRVEVLRFRGCPAQGVVRSVLTGPQVYRPPVPGTPVVLVSDLGRARPPFTGAYAARAEEWRRFVEAVVHAGCPVICLTPYDREGYPPGLREKVALVPFDRRITLGEVRQATSRARDMMERS